MRAFGFAPRSSKVWISAKAALRSALSDAVQSGKLAIVHGLAFDGPRTKDAIGVLGALELEGLVLLVLAGPDVDVEKSFANLPNVKVDYPGNLSTYDLLYADHVLFTSEALDTLTGERGPVFEEPEPEPSDAQDDEPAESEPDQGEDEGEEVEP